MAHRRRNNDLIPIHRLQRFFAEANQIAEIDRDIITLGHRDMITFECRIDIFGSMSEICTTIREILTICERDFPNIPGLGQELKDLVFAKSV
ncbi:hypothetical protein DPMN_187105 [Dreissena polymorpha]|uniref:Uncharacterized protein n=1 Tax=Dreissena polymorpha TaxID=45954 RepID=A0A9D4IA53_DREPO|nr:hypothetical protein DPMN_187105 [Dreissena polymorpha]